MGDLTQLALEGCRSYGGVISKALGVGLGHQDRQRYVIITDNNKCCYYRSPCSLQCPPFCCLAVTVSRLFPLAGEGLGGPMGTFVQGPF